MTHDLHLIPLRADVEPGGVLKWNDETGELAGYNAEEVRAEALRARARGSVSYTPLSLYTTKDPLIDKAAMAILLARMLYKIPEPLLPFVDFPERDEPNTEY